MDRTEFEEFVSASLPALTRYARALAGDPQDAQDLVQDALLRVWRAWPAVRRDGNPLAYAKTVLVRLHIGALRRLRRRLAPGPALPAAVPASAVERVDDQHHLRGLLRTLPPVQRAVLVLTYLEDCDDRTIAAALRRQPSSIRAARSRALARLRELELAASSRAEGLLPHA
ncbi:sigma-70 family RNA polymerase sigma factor [Asanoa siamensis]|uniref:DNA-directed RNA polymerase sigma-70 factor n=1 Tax=Asanoa siamensis TaxID=926357 RepID=A0ABQ4CK33_9ACTN|nr:sigma-70 family RNA polymerase sigma factor [Asanoa siamensis]GIF71653.1 DNA-directed RNA polymerase sigma-70 factor [Asanoa siamensis]